MKNICFLIGNLNNSGGTERVTTLIANELAKNEQFNVTILNLNNGLTPFFQIHDSISLVSLYKEKPSFKKNFILTVLKIRNFIKKNNIQTLVVVDSIACLFTVPALIGLKVNHICWEHFNFSNNNGVKYRDIGRKLAACYCDYIVTLTKRDKKLWEYGLKTINAKIVPISNPTPYENVVNTPSQNNKIVLAVGRLTYQKGFDLLLEAWAKIIQSNPDWKLQIVGSGEDEAKLKSQAKNLNILSSVDFISATQNIEYYYKNASVFCLSSRFEGFGMVIIEAISFGLPIVSMNCPIGPADIINHNKEGRLVKNKDINDLEQNIKFMLNLQPNDYASFSRNCIESSKKYYINNIIKIWENIL